MFCFSLLPFIRISIWRLLCFSGAGSSGDEGSESSSDSELVDSSVSETTDLFDFLLCCFCDTDESESGSDFTVISLLFLLFRVIRFLPVLWFAVPPGAWPSGPVFSGTLCPLDGATFDEFFFSPMEESPLLLTVAPIAFKWFCTSFGSKGLLLRRLLIDAFTNSICFLKASGSMHSRLTGHDLELFFRCLVFLDCLLFFCLSSSLSSDLVFSFCLRILRPVRALLFKTLIIWASCHIQCRFEFCLYMLPSIMKLLYSKISLCSKIETFFKNTSCSPSTSRRSRTLA